MSGTSRKPFRPGDVLAGPLWCTALIPIKQIAAWLDPVVALGTNLDLGLNPDGDDNES